MIRSLYSYAQRGFLRDLLFNNISNAREVIRLKKLLHIDVNINTVLVLTIDNFYSLTSNKSELQRQRIRQNILAILEQLTQEIPLYVINISDETFALLVRIEQAGKGDLEEGLALGALVINRVQRETAYTVTVGVGRPYHDILNIHLSYKEAQSACSRKFFTQGGQVIHVSQIFPYSENLDIFSEEIESELTVKILNGNSHEAFKIIHDMLARSFAVNNINPLFIKTRLIDITIMLIKVGVETGASVERLSDISATTIRILAECDTANELSRCMEKTVENIGREIFATRKKKNLSSFENSLQYIHKNYFKPLTLEEVASYIHLNPYYFSHGFKSYTGMSFINYLTKVRIEETKKLLLANVYTISEVAKKVGYNDPNYFARVFKKAVGIPPNKYSLYSENEIN
ncbi:MAG: HTH-type transcriptional regulator YesS [Candidatus Dichloromethanomonas elyunquensis]|nr:MAG: HTH-type transcriptional regulator YesS [Candidatus Dichloromethanomonas elyunquensis]